MVSIASPRRHTISCMGDSLTHATQTFSAGNDGGAAGCMLPTDYYPYKLQRLLYATGENVLVRNWGVGGNTSAQMIGRAAAMWQYEIPTIASIYAGTNDPANATTVVSASSSTSFTVAAGKGAVIAAPGAYVLIGGMSYQVMSVTVDTITLTSAIIGGVPSSGVAVAIDTRANIVALITALKAQGCGRVLVVGEHMYNQTTGGETPVVQSPTYQALRAAQSAAAADAAAIYVDTFEFMSSLVVAGVYPPNSGIWMAAATGDVHLNALGQTLIARAIYSAISNQEGWHAALVA